MLLYGGMPGEGFDAKRVYQASTRDLSHFLAVFAEPGQGIGVGLEPPPQPPPTDSAWQRFLNWWRGTSLYRQLIAFLDWIEQMRERIEQAAQEWEEFQRNIRNPEWWTQQLTSLLLQCCGFALLPAGLVGLLWRSKKRIRVDHIGV